MDILYGYAEPVALGPPLPVIMSAASGGGAGRATPDAADVMTGGRVGGPIRTGDAYLLSTANDAALSLQREYPQTNLDGGLVAAKAKAKSRGRVIGTLGKTTG